jgi:hypothetical protein
VLFKHQVFPPLKYVCLQVKVKLKGQDAYWRPARNWTKPEFIWHLNTMIDSVHAKAKELDLGHLRWRFAFDNPSNHNVKASDLTSLLPGEEIIRPPRYSPELMQAIEHCHGYTRKAYLAARMALGQTAWDIQAEWMTMRETFFQVATPETVSRTVDRVQEAARQIVEAGGGRIERKYR